MHPKLAELLEDRKRKLRYKFAIEEAIFALSTNRAVYETVKDKVLIPKLQRREA